MSLVPADAPPQVRRAVWLVATCALLSGAAAVLAMLALSHLSRSGPTFLAAVDRHVGDKDFAGSHEAAANGIAEIHSSMQNNLILGVVAFVVLAAMTLALRRPRERARLLTWIGTAVLALATVIVVATDETIPADSSSENLADIREALANLVPGWYASLASVLAFAELAAMLVYSILLVHHDSADFYGGTGPDDDRLWHLPSATP